MFVVWDLGSASIQVGENQRRILRPGKKLCSATALADLESIGDCRRSGGTMPKVLRDFIKRTTDPNQGPLTYEEARQFYSNASTRLSAEEAAPNRKLRPTPRWHSIW